MFLQVRLVANQKIGSPLVRHCFGKTAGQVGGELVDLFATVVVFAPLTTQDIRWYVWAMRVDGVTARHVDRILTDSRRDGIAAATALDLAGLLSYPARDTAVQRAVLDRAADVLEAAGVARLCGKGTAVDAQTAVQACIRFLRTWQP